MIDLRSDTVTKPTDAMRRAAFEAEVGDDVYVEDPSVLRLEAKAAEILGKEAAIFVTSGTQGNQMAVLTHCLPGNEVIIEQEAHLFYYEGAAMAAFAGVQPRTIKGINGAMDPMDVAHSIRSEDIHFPETGLICLENTHNRAGGAIVPLENMKEIYQIASENKIPVHLDGARLFNASVASGVPIKDYADQTDSVQICLSKGLGAPIGSVLAGSAAFIERARKWRKRLGGGLRQVGIIAAPAYVALTEMVERLSDDHHHAKRLAEGISQIKGLKVENDVDTNIVLLNVKESGHSSSSFLEVLKEQGVLATSFGPHTIRLTTHYDVSGEDIEVAIQSLNKVAELRLSRGAK